MSKRSSPLLLSVARMWLMSLTFRLYYRQRVPSFGPGLRHMLRYELGRLGHALYEPDRLKYLRARLLFWWRRS